MFRVRFYDQNDDIVYEVTVKARKAIDALRKARPAHLPNAWASFVRV